MPKTPLEAIQRAAWHYLWKGANPRNGLVPDHIEDGKAGVPASIAVVGMALSALAVGVENGWISRRDAASRAGSTLRFFAREAVHHGGFFFHFLDVESGARAWNCEISSIDSTLLFLGALFCGAYFDLDTPLEREIRALGDEIFARANWGWFRNGDDAVSIAFTPERGFSKHGWRGYNEGLLVAVLALGSPTFPLPTESYAAWTSTYRFKRIYGRDLLFCGPLFTHLFPHLWLDLRGAGDAPLRSRGLDFWENTTRAIEIQVEWARRRGDARKWGVSACDAPQGGTLGGYRARGVPWGRFDEVFSPPVCLASLPFAPDLALEGWNYWRHNHPEIAGKWGVRGAIAPQSGWMSGWFGLDQGLLVLMLENARSGLLWEVSRRVAPLQKGRQTHF